jgi:hypothetical protein
VVLPTWRGPSKTTAADSCRRAVKVERKDRAIIIDILMSGISFSMKNILAAL